MRGNLALDSSELESLTGRHMKELGERGVNTDKATVNLTLGVRDTVELVVPDILTDRLRDIRAAHLLGSGDAEELRKLLRDSHRLLESTVLVRAGAALLAEVRAENTVGVLHETLNKGDKVAAHLLESRLLLLNLLESLGKANLEGLNVILGRLGGGSLNGVLYRGGLNGGSLNGGSLSLGGTLLPNTLRLGRLGSHFCCSAGRIGHYLNAGMIL